MNSVLIDISDNIKNKSILVVSDDFKLIDNLKDKEDNLNYKLLYFEQNRFNLIASKLSLFDVIVFDNRSDNNIEKFTKLFNVTNTFNINVPVIILDCDVKDDLTIYQNCNVYTILFDNINENILTSNISLCLSYLDNNRKVELENGYCFDMSRELLFNSRKLIKLTKTERALLKLLVERKNQLVTYETIERHVWKGKNFSKYTLRNMVKHIREKSDDNLVRNSSNRGYIISSI